MAEQNDALACIEAILDSCVAKGVPGVSAAIRRSSGQIHHLRAGYSNLETKEPLSETSAFGIGSITKVFIAVVVLQLVEEKRLRLDDTVSCVLKSNARIDAVPNAKRATIRQLLGHTSAIPSWEVDADWIRAGRGENIQRDRIWDKDEPLTYIKPSAGDGLETGEFSYSNSNYTILGLIIEHIVSNTAESEVRRRILEPLGMEHTYFDSFEQAPLPGSPETTLHRYHWATNTFIETAGLSRHFHHVHGRDDLVDVTDTNLSVSWAAGGMMSTPSDLLKFASALQKPAEEGGLLSQASLATLVDWHPVDEKQDMGHGIFRLRDVNGGMWAGHSGGVLGFSATWWFALEGETEGCAVAILSNVGTMHAGSFPASAVHDPNRLKILDLAAQS